MYKNIRLSKLISFDISLQGVAQCLDLVGKYRFWHSISKHMIYEYSSNSHHARLQQFSKNAAYYNDRGLYPQKKCMVSFPNNQYNTFPFQSDIVLSFWYYPMSFSFMRLVLIFVIN
jgi:hypothetical protein